ncbi:hypothetical protein BKA67DRAFT_561105 [Truncatella angustata]|uniref:Uncharacterized protein n=1 Tax=Truncatella angustata TaxID=152316 RepID=A0A9P9A015_9PEZI|nr:uncharacterized protein BKA67DRAFT_561105 [Truncatella angustata]KAH6655569.1 hypothetical protein BKA67DRAFT_561105 [Truncatella angustata]
MSLRQQPERRDEVRGISVPTWDRSSKASHRIISLHQGLWRLWSRTKTLLPSDRDVLLSVGELVSQSHNGVELTIFLAILSTQLDILGCTMTPCSCFWELFILSREKVPLQALAEPNRGIRFFPRLREIRLRNYDLEETDTPADVSVYNLQLLLVHPTLETVQTRGWSWRKQDLLFKQLYLEAFTSSVRHLHLLVTMIDGSGMQDLFIFCPLARESGDSSRQRTVYKRWF